MTVEAMEERLLTVSPADSGFPRIALMAADSPEVRSDRVTGGRQRESRVRDRLLRRRAQYAVLEFRPTADGDEIERYYGFDVALDHVAELLGVSVTDLPVPGAAEDVEM